MNALAEHIDQPDQRHRCVLLDARRLRCLDCDRTLVLFAGPSTAGTNSTSKTTPPRPDERCPTHLGWADACAGCAADRKASDNGRARDVTPTANVAAGAAATRAALTDARARRAERSAELDATQPERTSP